MTWVALKSLTERRTRAALTALAIVLGVAMIAGSLILTDTIDRAFTNIFSSSYTQHRPRRARHAGGRRLVRRRARPSPPSSSPSIQRASPASPRPAATWSTSPAPATPPSCSARTARSSPGNNPTFGFGVDPSQPRFNPLTLAEGAWAAGPDQVVIDVGTADAHGFAVGDRVRVAAEGPVRTLHGHRPRALRRRGLAGRRHHRRLRHPDRPQRARQDRLRRHPGRRRRRASPRPSWRARIAPAAARGRPRSRPATSRPPRDKAGHLRGDHLHPRLPARRSAGSPCSSAPSSSSTPSRSRSPSAPRELATLRTLGASRRQVLRSVIAEAGIIGLAASLVGPRRSATAWPRA